MADPVNLPVAPSLPLVVFVAAPDAQTAAAARARLANQTWRHLRVVYPLARAVKEAQAAGAALLLMLDGTLFGPMALESAWWALETNERLAFVVFGDERGVKTPMLDAVATSVVMRSTLLADGGASNDSTRLGLASVFRVRERGLFGQFIREPFATRALGLRAANAPIVRATATLRTQGVTDPSLGDSGVDAEMPRLPLQSIDERPLPDNAAVRAVKPGHHRILALLQGFPLGGYAAFNSDFLPRLVSAGNALTVCATEVWRTEWHLDLVRRATTDVIYGPGTVALSSMPRYVSYLIESRKIDVVFISHAFAAYRMLPWLRLRHPQTAFIDYVHTDWFETGMYGSYATLSAAHSDWLDLQVASSQVLAAELVQRGADSTAMRAITINLDINEWDPAKSPREAARRALGCAPEQPLILFSGRTSSEKRPLLAVECWKQLIAAGVDARFALVGVGPLLQETKAAVANAGLSSRVVFLGELDSVALREVYAAADVFHAPSEIEGIARSLFEAMAMECVPVVADVGGQRELVTADCGFLVPHGSNEVERYVVALKAAISAEDLPRLAKAARARIVENFTAAQCVAGFESAFTAAIERRRANPSRGLESKAAGRELAVSGLEIARRHYWTPAGR